MRNLFSSQHGETPKSLPNTTDSKALLPTQTAIDAANGTFVFMAFTANKPALTAAEVLENSAVMQEAGYSGANAAGDRLGHGAKGHNAGLHRENGSYPCTRENVSRALQALSQAALDELLARLNLTVESVATELKKFPREISTSTSTSTNNEPAGSASSDAPANA